MRLGTQGFAYRDWVGVFYPEGTGASRYLDLYSSVYDTVELDTTFYGAPRPETIRSWHDSTPENFCFTAKMPKIITHDLRLVNAERDLVEFLTAMEEFKEKLGPIVIQMPPSFSSLERASLEKFAAILPEEFRYTVELRHRSWLTPETEDLLREHRLAWTLIDLHGMPKAINLTTDFTYVRWLGNRSDVSRLNKIVVDRSDDLAQWAVELDRIAERVRRIYGYMNNHYAGHSPASLNALRSAMGMAPVGPPAGAQMTLEM
jgi:uncharacterized protein YecE (DUF72 family)